MKRYIGLTTIVGLLALGSLSARRAEVSHAPADFGFVFETGYGERVDTFHGLVTKDLVVDPDTTIKLVLTRPELDSLYKMMAKLEKLPDLQRPPGCTMEPSTWLRLVVVHDSTERRYQWEYSWGCSDSLRGTNSWKALWEIIDAIRNAVEARPEYKALPRPRGGYI